MNRSASHKPPVGKILIAAAALLLVLWMMAALKKRITTPEPTTTGFVPTPVPRPEESETPAVSPAGDAAVTQDFDRELEAEIKNTVVAVISGDLVLTGDNRQVRYLAINAPPQGQPYFAAARDFNDGLVKMRPLRLETCPERPVKSDGPIEALVFVGETSVEMAMLAEGLAEVRHLPKCIADCRPYWQELYAAFFERRGMFAATANEPTPAILADRLIGGYGLVAGVVNDVERSTRESRLLFGSRETTDFTVAIPNGDLSQFAAENLQPSNLVGMEITVFGKVAYGPRLTAVCPAQIVRVRAP